MRVFDLLETDIDFLTAPIEHDRLTGYSCCYTRWNLANMAAPHAEDLEPEVTEGFKVGEKKTIDEYQQLGE